MDEKQVRRFDPEEKKMSSLYCNLEQEQGRRLKVHTHENFQNEILSPSKIFCWMVPKVKFSSKFV